MGEGEGEEDIRVWVVVYAPVCDDGDQDREKTL
jgi:hypothetical protein